MNATVAHGVLVVVKTKYQTTERNRWEVGSPIYCQADLDEARYILQVLNIVINTPGVTDAMRKHMNERIRKVLFAIEEREENSI